ncbi:MAG: hypothetical protein QG670_2828 [Thermoproteota archaeon]|nr:hypothetical protein [Thermoproteota archaeon]
MYNLKNEYTYKLVSIYTIIGISKFKVKTNDNTSEYNTRHRAICLLEERLTRANRAQIFSKLNSRVNQIGREASKLNLKNKAHSRN